MAETTSFGSSSTQPGKPWPDFGSNRGANPGGRTWRHAVVGAGVLAAVAILASLITVPGTVERHHETSHDHGAAVHMQTAAGGGAQAVRPASVVKPISCEKLPHVPGKSLSTLLVQFPPNAHTPKHRHGGSVTAFVLKGTLRSQLNLDPPGLFKPGDTWFEPPGTIHTMIENVSTTEPAEILAIFVADDCAVLTTFID